jgi:20S proteasome subunit beta 2
MHQVYPHGSTDSLPYATMGSGSLNAMAVFESGFREGLDRAAAIDLAARAVKAGIYNDLGSGSNVDLCVITAAGVEYLRGFEVLAGRTYERTHPVVYPPGTTQVSKTVTLRRTGVGGGEGEATAMEVS